MTARQKREPRAVTVAEIGEQFELASYWFGENWCPAVYRKSSGGYGIRIVWSQSITIGSQQISYEYFEVDASGAITTAPRGYAREFKPGRVADIDAAVEHFESPQHDARRITFGGDR